MIIIFIVTLHLILLYL